MTPRKGMNEPHTPAEFAKLLGVGVRWVRDKWDVLPGTIDESREVKFIIPQAWAEARIGRKR